MRNARIGLCLWSASLLTIVAPLAMGAPGAAFKLVIKNQAFAPQKLTVPAGKTVKILVTNKDAMPAEFESYDFNRETVIPGGSLVPVYVGPLKPGTYQFFNDFHPTSKGTLVVRPSSAGAAQ